MKITPENETRLYVEDLENTDLLEIESDSLVEIVQGDPSRDRPDARLPVIRFRGNGSLHLIRLDNVVADHMSLRGPDLVMTSPRQCHFRTIQSSQCLKSIAMSILCTPARSELHNPDGPNNCRFDYVSIRNCTSLILLMLLGGSGSQRQKVRDMSFGQTFLHPTWEGSGVADTDATRTYLSVEQATGIIMSLNRPTTSKRGDVAVRLKDTTNCSITSIVRGPGQQVKAYDASLTKNFLKWELKS